ncbi:MAG: TetR/AcrR family transcriptional regulator C-terminal domain-containing protein [Lachnospiraceae bacterium]|nr:TetR/AcrR family transcriptional regulator C-terminal domain-containing protein [Lachnospiraceae bacterium]MDD7378698.1 TetR/AcrR family transcriptional regulator C-terminal domain-containing protein [Lachnospiraceae bacterium]MDY4617759.1 TetR/AcrR family transcriptional regulator C-terminal domain-containing protein [Lachnospiraceae bacterium]
MECDRGNGSMCCNTKEKIATAVKELMRQKSIRKITVQDIMDETGMKRQSFYYHFQDIYDVIKWICFKELIHKVDVEQETSIEEWLGDLIDTIEEDRCFYRKLANEVEWRRIALRAKEPVAEQIEKLLLHSRESEGNTTEENLFLIDFFSTSLIYYLLDFISNKKIMTEEERRKQIALAVQALGKFNFGEGIAIAKA